MKTHQNKQLYLASSSLYKRQLLARLHIPFETISIETDEQIRDQESPDMAAIRLARQKALCAANLLHNPASQAIFIIACDQVAYIDGMFLSKPGSYEKALGQLQRCSQQRVDFYTAVCLYNAQEKTISQHLDLTKVYFRKLTDPEIRRYLEIEKPYDCAGSFKAEGLGISLFEEIDSSDPSALIGLPLIALSRLLREHSFSALTDQLMPNN